MASAAQIEANRLNAAASCGPKTPVGKARSSRNHLKFGLFSTQNCVRPEETAEYTRLSKALWKDLNPIGPVEQMLAVEIVRAAWRLQRCAIAEAEDGENPATQASIDRARASAHNSLRRLINDLRQFQSDRWLRAQVLREGFDEDYIGIADAHRVIKGLIDNSRLQSQLVGQAILLPANFTEMGQASPVAPAVSAAGVGQALSPGNPNEVGQASRPVDPPTAPTNRTQSVAPAVSAAGVDQPSLVPAVSAAGAFQSPAPDPWLPAPGRIPRNAPCPCQSGLKYKRCCGPAAPPVLTTSRGCHKPPPL